MKEEDDDEGIKLDCSLRLCRRRLGLGIRLRPPGRQDRVSSRFPEVRVLFLKGQRVPWIAFGGTTVIDNHLEWPLGIACCV